MNSKMTKWILVSLLLGLAGVWFAAPARAQVSGATLSGTITDAQGGAVADAKVTAKNLATGVSVDTTTNTTGAYTIPNLIAADYEVSVTATGFSTTVSRVTLTVGAKQEMDLMLTVGQVQQEVQVTGAAPQVELETSTISDQVSAATVRELPLNGRDWASLATLQPSVVEARTHLDVTHVGGGGGRGFGDQLSVGGGRPTQNSYRLDGAIVNDYSNAGPGSVLGANLGVDAIQEFSVLTSNYSAEYGFTSGGVINAITRSGTNAFHGTAFDFVRNDVFDATNFFSNANGLAKNQLIQNQFGAAAGYKILKDKLFLFGDYEGVRRINGLPVTTGVSFSDAVRGGNVLNLITGAPVHVSIDPNIAKYLGLFPHPATGATGCVPVPAGDFSAPGVKGGCNPNIGNAPFLGKQKAVEDFYTLRADLKISSKDSFFATFLHDNSTFNTPLTFNDDVEAFTSYREAIVAEETHVFSAAWANSIRAAIDRTSNLGGNTPTVNNPLAGDPTLGMLPGIFSPGITLTAAGLSALPGGEGGGASIQDFWGQIFQIYDDAFSSRGNHGLKFGFSFLAQQLDGYTPLAGFNGAGTFTYKGVEPVAGGNNSFATAAEAPCYSGTGATTGSGSGNNYDPSCGTLVNFLTNNPQTATRPFASQAPDVVNKHYLRDKIYSGYVQDDWRIRHSLTLNLGLRYEMSTIPTEIHGEIAIMPTPYMPLPCGPVTPGTCPQPSSPGSASLAGTDPTTILRNSYWTRNPTTKNFEPRIGFAWDPFHNGKTAVRGGFGIFDALPLPYELILNSTSSAPWRSTLQGPGTAVQPSAPQGVWPFGIPALATQHILNPIGRSFMYVDNDIKRNYVYQYNLNIQRQLTNDTTLLIGYSGSRGIHNPFQSDTVNTVLPTLSPAGYEYWPIPWSGSLSTNAADARLLNPTTGSMYNTMWEAQSWYNSMQIKIEKRLSHGFQIQGAFTYSKSIDDSSGSTAGDTFQLDAVSEPWYNLSLDKGLSDFDVRRNLVINGLWNVPAPHFAGHAGEYALGGWQLGLITTLADGVPFYPQITTDFLGEVVTTDNSGNLVPGCSAQNLANQGYRNSLVYVNQNCLSLPLLSQLPGGANAANTAICDSAGRGFTPAVLALTPCANVRGNLGRDTIIGPGLFDMDFSLFKNNYIRKISETFNVQFRAEFFNILNRTNFAPPAAANLNPFNSNGTANVGGANGFGILTSTQVPNRQIQFALKLIW